MATMIEMAGLSSRPGDATASGRSPALVDRAGSGRTRFALAYYCVSPFGSGLQVLGSGKEGKGSVQ